MQQDTAASSTDETAEVSLITAAASGVLARALYDFAAVSPDTLRFSKNDMVRVLGRIDENWWAVQRVDAGPNSQGLAPQNHLELIGDRAAAEALLAVRLLLLRTGGFVFLLDGSVRGLQNRLSRCKVFLAAAAAAAADDDDAAAADDDDDAPFVDLLCLPRCRASLCRRSLRSRRTSSPLLWARCLSSSSPSTSTGSACVA
jgi:hypothetical protein